MVTKRQKATDLKSYPHDAQLKLFDVNGVNEHVCNNLDISKSASMYDLEMEVLPEPDRTKTQLDGRAGWDGMDYSEDVLNFKTKSSAVEPRDRWRIVFWLMLFNGIAVLMPWNMFITAKAYFEDYKLNVNGTSSEYRDFFMNYLGITSQLPSALMSFLNVACHCGAAGNALRRMLWSIIIITAMFIITVVLAIIDTSSWPVEFFWITMVTVVVINSANGVFQNSVFGVAAKLPMKYTNAVILGSNLSGTVAAIVGIISIAVSPNLRIAAIYYFITAIIILMGTFDCYFILPLTRFYRYHDERSSLKDACTKQNTAPPYKEVFKKIWVQMLNVWFIFFITLALFPAIQAAIRPLDPDFPVKPKYWTPIFCFLSFNLFAMLGTLATVFVKFPSARFMWIPIVARAMFFVPFFMLCNYRPDVRDLTLFPVIVSNDWVYIVGSALNSFLSGYLSSLCMMYAPKLVPSHMASTAGMMMGCTLVFGVFTGTLLSLALAKIFTEFGTLSIVG